MENGTVFEGDYVLVTVEAVMETPSKDIEYMNLFIKRPWLELWIVRNTDYKTLDEFFSDYNSEDVIGLEFDAERAGMLAFTYQYFFDVTPFRFICNAHKDAFLALLDFLARFSVEENISLEKMLKEIFVTAYESIDNIPYKDRVDALLSIDKPMGNSCINCGRLGSAPVGYHGDCGRIVASDMSNDTCGKFSLDVSSEREGFLKKQWEVLKKQSKYIDSDKSERIVEAFWIFPAGMATQDIRDYLGHLHPRGIAFFEGEAE